MLCKRFNQFALQYPKFTAFTQAQVNFFRPFKHVGIDYTGHLFIKTEENQNKKMFILLFTCLNIRAIHLELLPDMSHKNFLMAFLRFSNFYGIPDYIYSDNAKTFLLGGKTLAASLKSSEFEEHMQEHNIKHITIPVYSAWMGAAWERLIRVVKNCLYKAIGRSTLGYYDLLTLLSNIQNSVNSRPLTYMSSEKDLFPLTPNSFLNIHSNARIAFKTDREDDPLWNPTVDPSEKLNQTFKHLHRKFDYFRNL